VGGLGKVILFALILPFLLAVLLGYPFLLTLALIGSGFLLEYGAAPVGIALGLNPFFVGWVLVCAEIVIFFGLFEILDSLGHTWTPVTNFLEKGRQTVHRSILVEMHGIFGLISCEILIGVYANVPISWVLGWNKYLSLALTLIGYIPSLVLTILTTVGLVGAFFPGSLHL
jgi:hypothetical protein